jgi:hypothetical protein
VLPLFLDCDSVNPGRGPCYDPVLVERLARAGRVVATKRVMQWLVNHEYDAGGTILDILCALSSRGRFVGSCELVNDEVADEYVVSLDEDWYVKFWIEQDTVVVNVWSCCWDGTVH